ncbi:MAG: DUF1330 domain-containing protein [Dehalococcoidia bacterium]|nr:DUF1330 domain-containing protein [Dehalococcoidia bacterium]|tara:strand:+ start:183 stop:473 length:291 start_codon:yes stop_codon:yes gene_type:complete
MAAYVIGAIQSVNDPTAFSEYQNLALPTLAKYCGTVVIGSTKIEVADGNWSPTGMVVVEFETMAKAKEWYNSPDYNPLVLRRTASADSGVIFVDGD